MDTLLGIITFGLFIALIVGLVKPALILRWVEKPTRLKVFGFWIVSVIGISVLSALFISDEDIAKSNIETARKHIEEEKYESAISNLNDIKTENPLYEEAQQLLHKADSLSKITEKEKQVAIEIAEKKKAEEGKTSQIEQLEREIKSVNKGVDFTTYRGTVDALQMELVLFGTWANIITDGLKSDDAKIKKLATQLKTKVIRMQTKEFPILRKEYGKIVANKMWENDIEVTTNGTGRRYINFSGGVFAANKNKKEFQTQVQEVLRMFRFTQSRYRWYKGQDEYTYYSMKPDKDSALMKFDK
jgi:hypothetical protein